ncbi:MAG: flavin monoamine oxidase family protein [Janthinobacterium lividum]
MLPDLTGGHVVVVGAGAAGLAASAALRAAGASVTLIEAGARCGGRARTERPAALAGAAFDHGASWLHDAGRNPLADLARAGGHVLLDAPEMHTARLFVDARPATPGEHDAYAGAEARWSAAVLERLARLDPGADTTLADAGGALGDDPWRATLEAWEGAVIAAADADVLSVRDWHRNALGGANLRAAGGLGDLLLATHAAEAARARLRTPATRVDWGGPGVRVETPAGTIRADACIVTVSTGVLRAGAIRFHPALPPATRDAIGDLPMGLLSKVALRAAGPDRLGLPDSCTLERRFRPGEAGMVAQAWPDGAAHLIGFVGGRAAWDLAGAPPGTATAYAREQLRLALGAGAGRTFAPEAVETTWGSDPLFLGAYAYAPPGQHAQREALGRPIGGGRLVFAGEAVRDDGLAGTVGGAILSGRAAAGLLAR